MAAVAVDVFHANRTVFRFLHFVCFFRIGSQIVFLYGTFCVIFFIAEKGIDPLNSIGRSHCRNSDCNAQHAGSCHSEKSADFLFCRTSGSHHFSLHSVFSSLVCLGKLRFGRVRCKRLFYNFFPFVFIIRKIAAHKKSLLSAASWLFWHVQNAYVLLFP